MALTPAQLAAQAAKKAKGGYNYNTTPKPAIKPSTSTTGVKPAPVVKPIGNNVFGDVSGASTALKNQNMGVVTANKGLQMKPEDMVYGAGATQKEAATPGYLQNRNDQLAGDFFNKGLKDEASITAELSKNAGFAAATSEEQKNTVQGILNRMGGMTSTTPEVPEAPVVPENAGKYTDAEGNLVDILGYNNLPDDVKKLVDGMTDAQKKEADMLYGNDLNAKAEYYRQGLRTEEYLQGQRDLNIQVRDANGVIQTIQASQRLKDASKQVDNLIQNAAYLGDRGQPGSSGARLQAAKQMIVDAQQKFADMKVIEQKVAQIRELGDQIDTKAFEKQMADISDDLNMKVGSQIQNAMNDMTSADLAGQLDTIDGVTQFKRSLLQKLDANITGYTEGSMKQMQYVTEQYDKLAQEAQTRLTEWTKNANTVNTDMSTAKGMYVDGNGNPLYTSAGATIPMPQKPPMDPIYDKESGKLITFSNDASGKIVANVQQVTTEATITQQTAQNYANLINSGQIKMSDIPKNMQTMVLDALANPQTNTADTTAGYQGPEIAPVAEQEIQRGLAKYAAIPAGTAKGECGAFVNDYLESIGLDRMFIDPIDIRKTQTNSDTPTVGSIAVFQYPPDANVSADAKKYGHVAIVTSVNADGSFNTVESNKNGDQKVFNRQNISASQPVGFFDPSKGLKPGDGAKDGVDYEQYGLLANTDFNKSNKTDADAKRYLDIFIGSGKFPTATSLYGTARAKDAVNFRAVADRANDLYYQAAGTAMPDPTMLSANKKLIQDNNKILNKQEILGDTINKNFKLAIDKEIGADINKNATAINKVLNPIYLALGDPGTAAALVSNGTISQEFANLISIRNSAGTLAADKMLAEELIPFGTSVEAQKEIANRLQQEAANIHSALQDQNQQLWSQIDPLELSKENPNRTKGGTKQKTNPWSGGNAR